MALRLTQQREELPDIVSPRRSAGDPRKMDPSLPRGRRRPTVVAGASSELFVEKFTRERVVPIISARVS